MSVFSDLRAVLSYLPEEQLEEVADAYLVAFSAHEGQHRSSGEPYISHPIEVAKILANMRMDHQSIMAAMLHDVIEDTHLDKGMIAEKFGDEVAELVDGVSKLDKIKFENRVEAQAENLRKMMLAMARDIRVILIKLADRLHNLRTLEALPSEKQRRIAKETLEIYAPIANRLGMHTFVVEFEDLGFSFLYPLRYRVLKEAVLKARGNRKELISDLESNLKKRLEAEDFCSFTIIGREKHLYSLYKKMRAKDLSLTEIMDVYALRFLVDTVDACYRVLGIVHSLYKPIHGRFKDYIAIPKANGYQSLHTTVVGPYGVPVEVQIRTEEMNRMAENGIAAHWLYKASNDARQGTIGEAEVRARVWLQGLLEIQGSAGNSKEFIEHVKVNLYPDEVYVFTPQGDIFSLPSGATAVDFAYAVHSDVGNSCIAVKIDRRLMPLSTRLSNGQTIEIITAAGAHPNPAWLSFVGTSKARHAIRHWLKTQQMSEARILGKRLIERSLSSLNLVIDDMLEDRVLVVLNELNMQNFDELCEAVGFGNQIAPLVVRRLLSELPVSDTHVFYPLAIRGTEGMVVSYATCCRPIPGDAIIGALNAGRGIVIHRSRCKNVAEISESPESYVFIQWDKNVEGEFLVELRVDALNTKRGVLAMLTSNVTDNEANVQNVNIDQRDSRHSRVIFLLSVRDRAHLLSVMQSLRALSVVTKVARV